MPKLIRIVSEDPNGHFDNSFNTDIILKKNDQIALQSASFSEQIHTVEIDDHNDVITFKYLTGVTLSIQLTHNNQYDDTNKLTLLQDIEDKLNAALAIRAGKTIGLSFKSEISRLDKISIGYNALPPRKFRFRQEDGQAEAVNVITDLQNVSNSSSGATTGEANKFYSLVPFRKGCMTSRCQIINFNDNSSGVEDNGIVFGLSSIAPNDATNGWSNANNMTAAQFTFNIKFVRTGTNYKITSPTIGLNQDGGTAPQTVGAAPFTNNDVLEWRISENKIQGVLFKSNPNSTHILVNEDLQFDGELYPYVIFNGAAGDIQIRNWQWTIDPYHPSNDNLLSNPDIDAIEDNELGANPDIKQHTGNRFTNNELVLHETVAEFLGYDNLTNTIVPNRGLNIGGNSVFFNADRLFVATLSNVSFIVQLRNVKIDSFNGDPDSGQRENIIGIIPQNTTDKSIVEYEPNNLYYVDINEDKLIRNLKARILRIDGSPPVIRGLSVLTFIVKEQGD